MSDPASGARASGVPACGDSVPDPATVHALLRARGQTVAVAESLTGGMLATRLTETPGASVTFRGGLVVYATDLKASLAGVPAPLLAAHGPVSPDVAGALAAGVRDRLGASYGVAVTGVAGPDRQGGAPVGTVYVALAGDGIGEVRGLTLSGDRAEIRRSAVDAALAVLGEWLSRAASGTNGKAAD